MNQVILFNRILHMIQLCLWSQSKMLFRHFKGAQVNIPHLRGLKCVPGKQRGRASCSSYQYLILSKCYSTHLSVSLPAGELLECSSKHFTWLTLQFTSCSLLFSGTTYSQCYTLFSQLPLLLFLSYFVSPLCCLSQKGFECLSYFSIILKKQFLQTFVSGIVILHF